MRRQAEVTRTRSVSRWALCALAGFAMLATACSGEDTPPIAAPEGETDSASEGESPTTNAEPTVSAEVAMMRSSNSMTAAPVLAALALDTFQEHGLTVDDSMINSSPNVLAGVVSGQADFGFLGGPNAIDGMAEGAENLVILSATARGTNELGLRAEVADELDVSADDNLEDRVAALRGRTIATGPPGGTLSNVFISLLESNGVDPADVEIVPSDPSAIIAGLDEGLYDGAFWAIGLLQESYASDVSVEWVPASDIAANDGLMQGVTVTSRSMVEESPDVVAAFMASLGDASAAIDGGGEEAKEAIRDEFFQELQPETYDLMWSSASELLFDAREGISQETFSQHLEVQGEMSGNDYSSVSYESAVYGPAQ